jgi:hypothetical protein
MAVKAAESLGICVFLDAEDFLMFPKPDRKCMITVLSEFWRHFSVPANRNVRPEGGKPPIKSSDISPEIHKAAREQLDEAKTYYAGRARFGGTAPPYLARVEAQAGGASSSTDPEPVAAVAAAAGAAKRSSMRESVLAEKRATVQVAKERFKEERTKTTLARRETREAIRRSAAGETSAVPAPKEKEREKEKEKVSPAVLAGAVSNKCSECGKWLVGGKCLPCTKKGADGATKTATGATAATTSKGSSTSKVPASAAVALGTSKKCGTCNKWLVGGVCRAAGCAGGGSSAASSAASSPAGSRAGSRVSSSASSRTGSAISPARPGVVPALSLSLSTTASRDEAFRTHTSKLSLATKLKSARLSATEQVALLSARTTRGDAQAVEMRTTLDQESLPAARVALLTSLHIDPEDTGASLTLLLDAPMSTTVSQYANVARMVEALVRGWESVCEVEEVEGVSVARRVLADVVERVAFVVNSTANPSSGRRATGGAGSALGSARRRGSRLDALSTYLAFEEERGTLTVDCGSAPAIKTLPDQLASELAATVLRPRRGALDEKLAAARAEEERERAELAALARKAAADRVAAERELEAKRRAAAKEAERAREAAAKLATVAAAADEEAVRSAKLSASLATQRARRATSTESEISATPRGPERAALERRKMEEELQLRRAEDEERAAMEAAAAAATEAEARERAKVEEREARRVAAKMAREAEEAEEEARLNERAEARRLAREERRRAAEAEAEAEAAVRAERRRAREVERAERRRKEEEEEAERLRRKEERRRKREAERGAAE